MRNTTAMTLRLPDDLAEELSIVAECDGEPVAEAVRAAITAWISRRRKDPSFQAALARHIERAQRLAVSEVATDA